MSVRCIDGQLWLDTARIESVAINARAAGSRIVRIIMQSGTIHERAIHHPQGAAAAAVDVDRCATDWIANHLALDRRHP